MQTFLFEDGRIEYESGARDNVELAVDFGDVTLVFSVSEDGTYEVIRGYGEELDEGEVIQRGSVDDAPVGR